VAEDGQQALQMLHERRYMVAFIEEQMPGMSGYEIAAGIRAAHGQLAPAIVALSAHAMCDNREEMLRRGFDEHMTKPVMLEELHALLQRLTGAALLLDKRDRHD
jgi:two-component system sensor histidine kinase BarA